MDGWGVGASRGEEREDEGLRGAKHQAKLRWWWAFATVVLSSSAGLLLLLPPARAHAQHGTSLSVALSPETIEGLTSGGMDATEGESNARRLRVELPSFTYDPLSEQASGMPGIPMGTDDNPVEERLGRDLQDGKPGCCSFEEAFAGLCYKRCSLLTNDTYTNRVAPNTCCKARSIECMFPGNLWVKGAFPGSGFIVDGDGGVPHPLGICDGNEELHAGMCYKRCSVLTSSEYPLRSAANTCCKKWPCLWAIQTEGGYCSGYGVGGGSVPKHRCPHTPTVV